MTTGYTPAMAKKKQNKRKSGGKRKDKRTLAEKADKYKCYQKSVQDAEHEVEFFERVYREFFGRQPQRLREDFCGTFSVCCEWAKSKRTREAIGVDYDPECVEWGREHNLAAIPEDARSRVHIHTADVREVKRSKAHLLAAQNFSFWFFTTRAELLDYFKHCRANLDERGLLVLDMMGGSDCYIEDQEDTRKVGGFTYVWGQERFNPITSESDHYISFRFKDGSALEKIFTYHWRFWTIPEVMELLHEAGFSDAVVYWEDDDEVYRKRLSAPSDASWIAYIVAKK